MNVFKFAFRPIPANVDELKDLTPKFSNLRLPLVILCIITLGISTYTLSKGVTGEQIFYYENGEIQAQGELVNGKENGIWKFFYQTSQKEVIGNYLEGKENGPWQWFYESGILMKSGHYKNGLFDDCWLLYNEEGLLIDSSNYDIGRLDGEFKSFYDNGQVYQIGQYSRDKENGDWVIFYDNGIKSASGVFENGEFSGIWKFKNYDGTPSQEINYLEEGKVRILSLWDINGNQLVKDGNGKFVSYFEDQNKLEEGKVSNGIKVGKWNTYYQNGQTNEIGEYLDEEYLIESAWTKKGEFMVKNGTGDYITYNEDSDIISKKGRYEKGLKEGTWIFYFPYSTAIQQESNFKNGKLDGRNITYYSNGNIISEGNLKSNKKVGEWKWYYETGQLQCTITYQDDKKHGDQIFWSESGIEAKKEVYDNGEFVSETLL